MQPLAGSQTNGRWAPIASWHGEHAHLWRVHAQQPVNLAKDRPGCRQIPYLHVRFEGVGLPHGDFVKGGIEARGQREGGWCGVSASSSRAAARLLRPRRAYSLNDDIHGTNHQAGRRTTATEFRAVPEPCQIERGSAGRVCWRCSVRRWPAVRWVPSNQLLACQSSERVGCGARARRDSSWTRGSRRQGTIARTTSLT